MVKPDIEIVHSEYARIYYGGRIYDANRMASGWRLTRQCAFEELAVQDTLEDLVAWVATQLV